jgi:hypothetical protein
VGGVSSIFLAQYFFVLETVDFLFVPLLFFMGGLFPDLDTHSTPSKWAARVGVIISAFLIYKNLPLYAALIGIIFMLTKVGKHRGWTHSITLCIALSLLGRYIGIGLYSYAFSGGILTHIIADLVYSKVKKLKKHF